MPLYIYWGTDSFSLREALRELELFLDDLGQLWASTVRLEGKGLRPQDLMEVCDALPFLGRHRLVVVEGLLGRFQEGSEKEALAGPWAAFAAYAARLPPHTHLVLIEGELSPQNPLFKALRPHAHAREFRPPRGEALLRWIGQRCRALGLRLSHKAARLLAELLGDDLWALNSELEKLAIFARGELVREAHVRELVAAARQANVFHLVDLASEGRRMEALRLLRLLLSQGEEPLHLLALIQGHYRRLLVAQELMSEGATPAQLAQELRLPPWLLSRVAAQARIHPLSRLRRIFRELGETEAAIKRGQMAPELALEALLFALAAA